jgi:hypothetical protein
MELDSSPSSERWAEDDEEKVLSTTLGVKEEVRRDI